jgi:solute carrier family 25 (mitochondrial carnitine/acylcarnitine transporter), member 20/29
LEYTIAASKGIHLVKPPGTYEAVKEIFRANGMAGLYTGFRLHLRKTYFRLDPKLG